MGNAKHNVYRCKIQLTCASELLPRRPQQNAIQLRHPHEKPLFVSLSSVSIFQGLSNGRLDFRMETREKCLEILLRNAVSQMQQISVMTTTSTS